MIFISCLDIALKYLRISVCKIEKALDIQSRVYRVKVDFNLKYLKNGNHLDENKNKKNLLEYIQKKKKKYCNSIDVCEDRKSVV